MSSPERGTVVAFAGRRIDAEEAEVPRFPRERVPEVRERLGRLLEERGAVAVVGSAACGADLLMLGAAEAAGIRSVIVLPFEADRFRQTSVVDRGAEWGPPFDRAVGRASAAGAVRVLEGAGEGNEAYAAANLAILDEAARLAAELGAAPLAVIVWDGRERPGGDLTAAFARAARLRGWEVVEVGVNG